MKCAAFCVLLILWPGLAPGAAAPRTILGNIQAGQDGGADMGNLTITSGSISNSGGSYFQTNMANGSFFRLGTNGHFQIQTIEGTVFNFWTNGYWRITQTNGQTVSASNGLLRVSGGFVNSGLAGSGSFKGVDADGREYRTNAPTGGTGSQTPWEGDIDAAGYNLTNASSLTATNYLYLQRRLNDTNTPIATGAIFHRNDIWALELHSGGGEQNRDPATGISTNSVRVDEGGALQADGEISGSRLTSTKLTIDNFLDANDANTDFLTWGNKVDDAQDPANYDTNTVFLLHFKNQDGTEIAVPYYKKTE